MQIQISQSPISEIEQQISVFSKAFKRSISLQSWIYKHYRSGNSLSRVFVAKNNNHIIGINAFIECRFELGGQEYIGMQSCDSAVDPDFRGQKVFSRIIEFAHNYYSNSKANFLFGFPNTQSLPGFLKLDFLHVSNLNHLSLKKSNFKYLAETTLSVQINRYKSFEVTNILENGFEHKFLKNIVQYDDLTLLSQIDNDCVIASQSNGVHIGSIITRIKRKRLRSSALIFDLRLDQNDANLASTSFSAMIATLFTNVSLIEHYEDEKRCPEIEIAKNAGFQETGNKLPLIVKPCGASEAFVNEIDLRSLISPSLIVADTYFDI